MPSMTRLGAPSSIDGGSDVVEHGPDELVGAVTDRDPQAAGRIAERQRGTCAELADGLPTARRPLASRPAMARETCTLSTAPTRWSSRWSATSSAISASLTTCPKASNSARFVSPSTSGIVEEPTFVGIERGDRAAAAA